MFQIKALRIKQIFNNTEASRLRIMVYLKFAFSGFFITFKNHQFMKMAMGAQKPMNLRKCELEKKMYDINIAKLKKEIEKINVPFIPKSKLIVLSPFLASSSC